MAVAVGDSFGHWTVAGEAERSAQNKRRWLCRCSCGTERPVLQTDLRAGRSRSCGCTRGRLDYWSTATIRQHLQEIAAVLGRMPSLSETKDFEGDSGLANAIMKSGGFRFWAEELQLELKDSETARGGHWEEHEAVFLLSHGLQVERQPVKAKFDLHVGGKRVDVKSATWTVSGRKGRRVRGYVFGGLKRGKDCDFFDLVCIEDDAVKHRFIIPSSGARITMLTITERTLGGYGKYSKFKDRVDLLRV